MGLWAQAEARLDSTQRDKLKALMGSTKRIASDHVRSVLSEAQKLKEREEDDRWKSILDRIVKSALVFKDIGDKVVAFDQSGYAGLGWSVVSFGLRFTANARDTREFALSSSEFVTDLLVRYKQYERFRDLREDQDFDELLVRVYKAILIYVIDLRHYLQQGSTGRTMRSGVPVESRSISARKQAIDAADVRVKDYITALFFKEVQSYLPSQHRQQSEDSQACLKSLAFKEMNDRFENISPALEGTCQWLLVNNEYREWTRRDRGLLWIKGKPGSGKSTLLRYALGHGLLESGIRDKAYAESLGQGTSTPGEPSCNDQGVIVLTFFFHGRGAELQKTPLGLYRSMLHQLLCHVQISDSFPDGFLATFLANSKNNNRWHWPLSQLKTSFENALHKVLKTRPVWIFVDALDEAGEDNAIELVKWFTSLIQKCSPNDRFRICFSCRHHPIVYDDAPKDATEICVEKYNTIISRANGVFMWAHLVAKQVQDLRRDGATWKKIKNEITGIPNELHQLYRSLVEKMSYKSESLKVFLWVAFSLRPLSPQEFGWAMMVDTDHDTSKESLKGYESISDWNWTGEFERNLKNHSSGLVEVAQSSSRKPIVQFIHQSVRDFFLVEGLAKLHSSPDKSMTNALLEGMAHHRLSKACIRYFKVEDFARYHDRKAALKHQVTRLRNFPFLRYAVSSWIAHEQESERIGTSQSGLLDSLGWPSDAVVQRSDWLHRALHPRKPGEKSPYDTIFHVASLHGLTSTLRMALQSSYHIKPDALNSSKETPLSWAAKAGHKEVVELLLQMGANVNFREDDHTTALQEASFYGHLSTVELLLQHDADVTVNNGGYGDALQLASAEGHFSIVKLLLQNGSNVNAQTGILGNALQAASYHGHLPIVELLLQNRSNMDAQAGLFGNALQAASYKGHLPIVELLLQDGCDVNAQGGYFGNSLQAASYEGHLPIVEVLLQNGVDINAQAEPFGDAEAVFLGNALQAPCLGNALQAALYEGHLAVVEVLLQNGIDVNAQGGAYGNALQAAASGGFLPAVDLLLSQGANVNAQGGEFGNALQAAAYIDSLPIVELLVDKGADVNSQGGQFGNALEAAIYGRGGASLPIIHFLIQHEADANAEGKYGTTFQAAERKVFAANDSIVELLLQRRPNT